ncbi:MAG TPA: fatty acyl-AMP ligase [Ramlibacter sp.]|uniref:fatty acyl-AMP ligase n=1 Tax=Ramlibacter sp. TaxID=1917967 RepID=UPI002BA1026F|nr:fatty acyl-AMP ligase [Ramlibacter sp.]HVZ44384.1 fatty acyl-AMP ligase [Ramlibacter sp.]
MPPFEIEARSLRGAGAAGDAGAGERTFVDVLVERAASEPDDIAFTFLGEGTDAAPGELRLTYRDLFEEAAGFASLLQAHGLAGERVLLVFKSNAWFAVAFFACLMAGAIAVPTAPPRREQLAQRLRGIAANAGARPGIADSEEVMQAAIGLGHDDVHWFDIRQLSRDGALRARSADWRPPVLRDDSLAFLQYTSGSTGDPKGVMVSHGNMMANSRQIARAFGHTRASRGLVSLPLYHDMGLIGGILQPVYAGFPVHVMTPAQFVQKPERWLQLISRLRITTSGGPNFMYDLAAEAVRPEHLEGVDLSSWRVAFCGAEPVRASTIECFTRKFAPYGLREGAFYPCYGMAEATLFVTGNAPGTIARVDTPLSGGPQVVGCGHAHDDTRIEIVDPAIRVALPDGAQGEIWVSGASVAQGYWRNPAATEHTFKARLAASNEGPFLRTGDLGYRKDGQLFVTGRLKDLIILRGRNFAPHDLETEAEGSHPGLQPGGGAAFTLTEGDRERLILAFELKREWRRRTAEWHTVEAAVRSSIARSYQLRVDDVVLLAPGALPRTSSGKVRRAQCRSDYLAGRLTPMAAMLPRTGAAGHAARACT